ncbi:hypothetical protein GUJ93_ZPchr0008g12549 [Zizania palustris]|uniref:Cyclin N-terminal domain-containing protein n=1 Tax=Zizania palustris TaxID=103762 RepID=A0A8J5V4N7_ZIZPA|nr:hypothetical protein GUJ93_ZPchr0008g12549 [Zizania palustris]
MGPMVAPPATREDEDDVAYLLCTEDASSGEFQMQHEEAVASTSSSPAGGAGGDGDYSVAGEEEASIAELIGGEAEHSHSPREDYPGRLRSGRPIDLAARADSIAWILKVREVYGLLPLTAYLAVSYMDRFLSLHRLPVRTYCVHIYV